MRGVVYTGPGAVEVTNKLTVRAPGPREVKVQIRAAGLCHSDVSVVNGTIPWAVPAVLGHEGAGVVIEVGSEVRSVVVGDHVILSTIASCGGCRQCLGGHPWRCYSTMGNRSQPFEFDGQPCSNFAATSCFAEETVVTEVQAIPIPKDVPFAVAALVGCGVITGAGAVFNRTDVQPGDRAIVFGVGGVGLNVIQALRIKQAGMIIAVDTLASKEAVARQFGATHFLDSTHTEDLVAAIRTLAPYSSTALTGPFNAGGMDWSYDVVGHPSVTKVAMEVLDWGGTCVVIGVPAPTVETAQLYTRFTHVDRNLIGCRAGSYVSQRDFPMIINLYRRGQFLLDELVTQSYPIESFHDAVHDMHEGRLARGVFTF
jgi:Zn-dependent alcohol dehydrogenase